MSDERWVVLRMGQSITEDDPVRSHDGIRIRVGAGTVRIVFPHNWSATRGDGMEGDDEVWVIERNGGSDE